MSYPANVIKIMIASPDDVTEEPRIARDVIYDWNATHSESHRIALLPVSWETHAAPALGDRPQELINRQVLRGCDVLIAIFWTRLGTPTGLEPSGTVEEIKAHLQAGKPAMVYFSSAPINPQRIDHAQLNQLSAFKDEMKSQGLIAEYGSQSQFKEILTRQLSQTILQHLPTHREPTDYDPIADDAKAPPSITDDAQRLLRAAAADGRVLMIGTASGTLVLASGEQFSDPSDPRSEAKCRRLLDELTHRGYLEDRQGTGKMFHVTAEGFEAADILPT